MNYNKFEWFKIPLAAMVSDTAKPSLTRAALTTSRKSRDPGKKTWQSDNVVVVIDISCSTKQRIDMVFTPGL